MAALRRSSAMMNAFAESHSDSLNELDPTLPIGPSLWERRKKRIPLWMRWKKFWGVVVVIVAIVGVGIWNLTESDASLLRKARLSVLYLARAQAGDLTRQLRTSVGSLQALEGIAQIDPYNLTVSKFDRLAETLIRTYKGITSLQLAPNGTICCAYPLVDETQDNRAALGHALLLDPLRKEGATEAILSRRTHVVGPLILVQGGIGVIARRPIFTRYAPQYLPDEWWVRDGVNYSRICSVPELRHANCSFPGPPESDGTPTYFWGFAVLLFRVADLLTATELASLETGVQGGEGFVAGISQFAFELFDPSPHPSLVEQRGVLVRSNRTEALRDAEEVDVMVEEFALHWKLKVAPLEGWPIVSEDFWRQLLVVLPLTALLGALLGFNIIHALRRHARALQQVAEHLSDQKMATIRSAVNNLNSFQFPMYLVELSDFLHMGRLVRHEAAREAGKLRCFDLPEEALEASESSGVVFVSHQWAGFDHPDPDGVQYKAMVVAIDGLQDRGISCGYIWVDYTSIPQRNAFQQQAAVNSLSVYASLCSVLVTVAPNCDHADTGMELNLESYGSRGWCRLELLSYKTGSITSCGARTTYVCDGQGLRTAQDFDNAILDHAVLHVLGGCFTCCSRRHLGHVTCDRQKIRDALLGIYWRLLAMKRDGDRHSSLWADGMLKLASTNIEKYFPSYSLYSTASGDQMRQHFDGYLPLLHKMFASDSELDGASRLPVFGRRSSMHSDFSI